MNQQQIKYLTQQLREVEEVVALLNKQQFCANDVVTAFLFGFEKGQETERESIECQINEIIAPQNDVSQT